MAIGIIADTGDPPCSTLPESFYNSSDIYDNVSPSLVYSLYSKLFSTH